MRILLKCPTRSRPARVLKTLSSYVRLAAHPELLGVAVSCDADDATMATPTDLRRALAPCAWSRIFYGHNGTKIAACNANMQEVDWEWDIVVLVSDDMVPQIRGYDDIIRTHMASRFPDRNGILWFDDGCQGDKLNTLCIYGRTFYDQRGVIYDPSYKSLFCDTELTDHCRMQYADRCLYVPYCIIRHEHPGTGYAQYMDALYDRNQKYWNEDMYTYISRKAYAYDWSVLVPTIPGREESLQSLLASIREKVARLAPHLRVEYCINFDNREKSIGTKRNELLQGAKGKYMAFIDDDDAITDAYIEDLRDTIAGHFHVMRLRGQIQQYTFTHSLENTLSGMMAAGEVFLRPPNHLNPMLTDVAKFVSFGDATRGEDLDWTIRMARRGFLEREFRSDPSRIHYLYQMGDRKVDPASLEYQRNTSYETMLKVLWTPAGAVLPTAPALQAQGPRIPILRLGPRGFVSS
jgi:glycosyltransferase involved in cell wall biosynthesis